MGNYSSKLNSIYHARKDSLPKWRDDFDIYKRWKLDDVEYFLNNLHSAKLEFDELREELSSDEELAKEFFDDCSKLLSRLNEIKCTWKEFYEAVCLTEKRRTLAESEFRYHAWHPAVAPTNYAMEGNDDTIIAMKKYASDRSTVEVEQDQRENDGYTSDEESFYSDFEDNSESSNLSFACNDSAVTSTSNSSSGSSSITRMGSFDSSNRPDVGNMKYKGVKPIPEFMDSEIQSPVYFGYQLDVYRNNLIDDIEAEEKFAMDQVDVKVCQKEKELLCVSAKGESSEQLQIEIELLKTFRSKQRPIFQSFLEEIVSSELNTLLLDLQTETEDLGAANEQLLALNEEFKHISKQKYDTSSKSNLRSIIIATEGKIRQFEKRVTDTMNSIALQEKIVHYVKQRKRRERAVSNILHIPEESRESINDSGTLSLLGLIMSVVLLSDEPLTRKIYFLSECFDLNRNGFLGNSELFSLFWTFFVSLTVLLQLSKNVNDGQLLASISFEFIQCIVLRTLHENDYLVDRSFNDGGELIKLDLRQWIMEAMTRSQLFSTMFKLKWKFEYISVIQQKLMHPLRSHEIGLISKDDKIRLLDKLRSNFCPNLNSREKKLIHETAIGEVDDVLRSNYVRFASTSSRRKNNAKEELNLGYLENLQYSLLKEKNFSAETIQRVFKGYITRIQCQTIVTNFAFFAAFRQEIELIKYKFLTKNDASKTSHLSFLNWIKENISIRNGLMVNRAKAKGNSLEENAYHEMSNTVDKFQALAIKREMNVDISSWLSSPDKRLDFLFSSCIQPKSLTDAEKVGSASNDDCIPSLVTSSFKIRMISSLFPSELHVCRYVRSFEETSYLANDISKRFELSSKTSETIAKQMSKLAIENTEFGWLQVFSDVVMVSSGYTSDSKKELEGIESARKRVIHSNRHKNAAALDMYECSKHHLRLSQQVLAKLVEDMKEEEKELKTKSRSFSKLREKMYKSQDDLFHIKNLIRDLRQQSPTISYYEGRDNWNERYYRSLSSVNDSTTDEDLCNQFCIVRHVAEEFLIVAKTTAVTIISEMYFREKSIEPSSRRSSGWCCGKDTLIYYLHGIQFKVLSDNDGYFNGSDEFSAKLGGHEVRASLQFLKHADFHRPFVYPLQATIDFGGFRVLATAMSIQEDESVADLVMGTHDGKIIMNNSTKVDQEMCRIASKLNLARHLVKGESDIGPKSLYHTVDLKCYKKEDKFIFTNFWRCFPSENPSSTEQLFRACPRNMSVLWRMFRPEFVRTVSERLSADANCKITEHLSDMSRHQSSNKSATDRLLLENILKLAEYLVKSAGEIVHSRMDITSIVHRHGVNIRHIGLLRNQFWRTIPRALSVTNGSTRTRSDLDFRKHSIVIGSHIKIANFSYVITSVHDKSCGTYEYFLDKRYSGESCSQVDVSFGKVSSDDNSTKIRELLLGEMIARTTKAFTRNCLRYIARKYRNLHEKMQKVIICSFLNLLTGSSSYRVQEYWTRLHDGIRERFGMSSVPDIERKDLYKESRTILKFFIKRFCLMLGITLKNDVLISFVSNPNMFVFVTEDLKFISPIVKHNVFNLSFAKALNFSLRFKNLLKEKYDAIVNQDFPIVYWPLPCKVSEDLFTEPGEDTSEFYCPQWPGITYDKGKNAQNGHKRNFKILKENVEVISIEAWGRLRSGKGTNRVLAMVSQSIALVASREERWMLISLFEGRGMQVIGPPLSYSTLQHVVATVTKTVAILYIDGVAFVTKNSSTDKNSGELSFFDFLIQERDPVKDSVNVVNEVPSSSMFFVGCAPPSKKYKDGSNFFNGDICHVSLYFKEITEDDVRRRIASALLIYEHQLERCCREAISEFISADEHNSHLGWCVRQHCNFLVYILSNRPSRSACLLVSPSIKYFEQSSRVQELARILHHIPVNQRYSNLFCHVYLSIRAIDPNYLLRRESSLKGTPFSFNLVNSDDKTALKVAADIFRNDYSMRGGPYVQVEKIKNDRFLIWLVKKIYNGFDKSIDLRDESLTFEVDDNDIFILSKNVRQEESFHVHNATNITDKGILSVIEALRENLKTFDISNCRTLRGEFLEHIGICPSLSVFIVRDCNLLRECRLLETISVCERLEIVVVKSCTEVSDTFLAKLGSLRYLRKVDVSCCENITNNGLKEFLSGNTLRLTLEDLNVSYCLNLSDEGLQDIAKLEKLSSLYLNGLEKCSECSIDKLLKNNSNLERLQMERIHLTGNYISASSLKELKDTNISGCVELLNLWWLVEARSLQVINMSGACLVEDHSFTCFFRNIKSLTYLNISCCQLLTNEHLCKILEQNHSLSFIDISGCLQLSGNCFLNLRRKVQQLRHLLSARNRITDEACFSIGDKMNGIVSLNMRSCKRISSKGLDYIRNHCLYLTSFDTNGCKRNLSE